MKIWGLHDLKPVSCVVMFISCSDTASLWCAYEIISEKIEKTARRGSLCPNSLEDVFRNNSLVNVGGFTHFSSPRSLFLYSLTLPVYFLTTGSPLTSFVLCFCPKKSSAEPHYLCFSVILTISLKGKKKPKRYIYILKFSSLCFFILFFLVRFF